MLMLVGRFTSKICRYQSDISRSCHNIAKATPNWRHVFDACHSR